ncbi:MAG: AbrB family transcriptional regulator [Candidatus Melainabacteria bacterium HGW-Melainabacteria-1]|nr:MAG: AbrB family transcriptional regulator [Candidatus Melainabacteria bacterium HGW-Melainabacteria-1]
MPQISKLNTVKTHLGKGGRIVIPAAYRKQLGLKTGDELLLRIQDGEIHLQSISQAVQRAQSLVSQFAAQRSLADELIAERRQEANGVCQNEAIQK